jgi:hypothetical protein
MFLIIWGFKSYATTMAMLNLACRNGHVAAHRLVKVTRKFTLFFIPLFPVSHKYFTVCSMCGMQVPWDKETAEAAVQQAGAGSVAGGLAGGPVDPVAPPLDTSVIAPGSSGPTIAVPAGWYPDPAGGGGVRYWDGGAWTESVHQGPA